MREEDREGGREEEGGVREEDREGGREGEREEEGGVRERERERDILHLKPQVEAGVHGRLVRLVFAAIVLSSELFLNLIGRLDQLTCQLTRCML